jgi:2'-5' RNA ligase
MKLRLFVGVTAPERWQTAISDWRRKAQSRFSDEFGRWTSESNLHLTLRFFGSVEEDQVVAIAKQLQQVAVASKPFSVAPASVGCFPNTSRPRIFWLGLLGATDALVELESQIRTATAEFGRPPEDRPFHPHLTLARLKQPTCQDRDHLAELIRKPTPIEVADWPIHEVELIRSQPGPQGSTYTTLVTIRLGEHR